VNKVVPAIKQEHIAQMSHSLNNVEVPWLEQPTCLKGTLPMTVDRMILTSNAEYPRLVKTVLRQTRRPELGDKLSSRHG
jgi:DNA-directed RNA polymerase III subunit RPC2